MALKQLKNGKAPGVDEVASELFEAGGKPILEELKRLFKLRFSNGGHGSANVVSDAHRPDGPMT